MFLLFDFRSSNNKHKKNHRADQIYFSVLQILEVISEQKRELDRNLKLGFE